MYLLSTTYLLHIYYLLRIHYLLRICYVLHISSMYCLFYNRRFTIYGFEN